MSTLSGPRSKRIRKSVSAAVLHWRSQNGVLKQAGVKDVPDLPLETVYTPMERRAQMVDDADRNDEVFPSYPTIKRDRNLLFSIRRLFTWISFGLVFLSGNFLDWILRKNSIERRAVRLRRGLERVGGTFVKLGQQAAMRIDLLPWAYCVELSRMLDHMRPFPVEHALAAIERTTGKPWQETFAVFDPKPIGSASIACVFQAVLKDGSKVAVKVRRPDIIKVFLADFQVLDWLATLAEYLTFFRPGFTQNLRAELRETLMEELDFRKESRFQDTFRRNAVKSGKDFFTAPGVFFELSGEEVLVQEFVSGLWLWEVISAVEQNDPHGRALLRELKIDPKIVARRILWAAFWSMDENIFFHADPHPANILVLENNELIFIDFGSCGSFNLQQRIALEQLVLSMESKDVEGMTLAALSLMEPLPPVDIPALVKSSQEDFMRLLNTFNTPAEYTEYWERTSARQWVVLVQIARRFNLPLNLHMLRMIRATLLYDSIVLRLDNQLDRYFEYTNFMKDRAVLVQKKWRKRIRDNAGDTLFLRVEDLGNSLSDLMVRAQTTLGKPLVRLGSTVDKLIFTASVVTRLLARVTFVSFLAIATLAIVNFFTGTPSTLISLALIVARNPFYQLFLISALILNLRLVLFRLRERELEA